MQPPHIQCPPPQRLQDTTSAVEEATAGRPAPPSALPHDPIKTITAADIKAAQVAKRQVNAFRKRRQSSRAHSSHSSIPRLPNHTTSKDNIGLLMDFVIPASSRPGIAKHLTANPRRLQNGNEDTALIIRGSDSILKSSFARLSEGVWLNDEIINYFCKHIIQPTHDKVHFFSSFFFSQLLEGGTEVNAGAVRRWHNRIQEGLFNLDSLLIPINHDQEHWLLLHIQPGEKTVHLYDSLGGSPAHTRYLASTIRYLHQVATWIGHTSTTLDEW